MRSLLSLLLLSSLGINLLLAQALQEECRLKTEDLRPIILRFNPFFANHQWDAEAQLEMAQMSDTHLLAITQDGCKRHHVRFDLIVAPEASRNSYEFWVSEVEGLMEKVYWERNEYQEFKEEFETIFDEKLHYYGYNHTFNFPVNSRNFICSVYYDATRGARISIEVVTFIFKEDIQRPSNQRHEDDQDDGWLGIRGGGN